MCCDSSDSHGCDYEGYMFLGCNSFQPHYDPGIDSASIRNEYQESSMGPAGA
jgi:hypothetical protein